MKAHLLGEFLIDRTTAEQTGGEEGFCGANAWRFLHPSGILEDQPNGRREAVPIGLFLFQVFLSVFCQRIVFRAPVVLRFAPYRLDPALLLQTVERGV